jgi:hypothetical protein
MPFRRAKLTACRKVRAMYRRYRAKSSRYGHETAMPQAFLLSFPDAGEARGPGIRDARKSRSFAAPDASLEAILDMDSGLLVALGPRNDGRYAGSMPLARMIRTAAADARNLTNARAAVLSVAFGVNPAEYIT